MRRVLALSLSLSRSLARSFSCVLHTGLNNPPVHNGNASLLLCLQAVLWALWSRLVRLHSYLRQLLAETPAQKLHLCVAVKRGDWKALAANVDSEVRTLKVVNLCDRVG